MLISEWGQCQHGTKVALCIHAARHTLYICLLLHVAGANGFVGVGAVSHSLYRSGPLRLSWRGYPNVGNETITTERPHCRGYCHSRKACSSPDCQFETLSHVLVWVSAPRLLLGRGRERQRDTARFLESEYPYNAQRSATWMSEGVQTSGRSRPNCGVVCPAHGLIASIAASFQQMTLMIVPTELESRRHH